MLTTNEPDIAPTGLRPFRKPLIERPLQSSREVNKSTNTRLHESAKRTCGDKKREGPWKAPPGSRWFAEDRSVGSTGGILQGSAELFNFFCLDRVDIDGPVKLS